jgi:hypothetical protein
MTALANIDFVQEPYVPLVLSVGGTSTAGFVGISASIELEV